MEKIGPMLLGPFDIRNLYATSSLETYGLYDSFRHARPLRASVKQCRKSMEMDTGRALYGADRLIWLESSNAYWEQESSVLQPTREIRHKNKSRGPKVGSILAV